MDASLIEFHLILAYRSRVLSSQRPATRAVRYCDGPLLVLAGAGSGKTRVITAKIAHLSSAASIRRTSSRSPSPTRRRARCASARRRCCAAGQRRRRAEGATISTFHSLGLRSCAARPRRWACKPGFSILDPADLEGRSWPSSSATADRGRARAAQWRDLRVEERARQPGGSARVRGKATTSSPRRGRTCATTTRSRAYQAVDFDDLIVRPLALFERDAEAARRWRARCEHLLVDEYQDTNPAQYRLLRAAGRSARAVHRGRRRRPGDLRLARRRRRQPARARRATIRTLKRGQARAELPLDRAHPALGQRADRQQPEALRQEAVERARHGRRRSASRRRPTTKRKPRWSLTPHRGAASSSGARRYRDFAILYRGNHQAQAFETALRDARRPVRALRRTVVSSSAPRSRTSSPTCA